MLCGSPLNGGWPHTASSVHERYMKTLYDSLGEKKDMALCCHAKLGHCLSRALFSVARYQRLRDCQPMLCTVVKRRALLDVNNTDT